MSFFNANVTGDGAGSSGLVTKFEKTVTISTAKLAEVVVNLADDISNYANITNEQIIVELVNTSAIAAGDATLSHTYNAETGDLTITSTNSSIPFASSSAVKLELIVYVAGAIQIPPAPKSVCYKLKQGTSVNVSNWYSDYKSLTKNNFLWVPNTISNGSTGFFNWSQDASVIANSKNIAIKYDNSTGVATISNTSYNAGVDRRGVGTDANFSVGISGTWYLVVGDIITEV